MRHPATLALLAAAAAIGASASDLAAQAIRINEVRIDQPGADIDEYFEIVGVPGSVLANTFYIVIGDGAGQVPPNQNGFVETVVNLSGAVIPADGLLLVAKNTFTLGTPDLIASFNFEELDNVTHLLVTGFTGFLGQKLDTNNDGTLDVTPWSAIVDDVALVIDPNPNGVTAEFFYSDTIVGPDGAFSPSHAWRCSDTLAWELGSFNISGDDTPGSPNPECLVAPQIVINEIRIEQPGAEADEYFELRGPAGASLNGLTYLVIGDPSDSAANTDSGVIEAVVSLDGFSLNGNGFFLVAEDDNTFGAIADLLAVLEFEGNDNVTHLLVDGFAGSVGDDLDTDDDGVLDIVPWTLVVDSVALLRSNQFPPLPGQEWVYSETTVGPEGPFVPGHVYRCVPDGTWLIGPFDPVGGLDTPGGANGPCIVCGIPGSGNCFEPHGGIGCDSTVCCETVCASDAACCESAWDQACADLAVALCFVGGPPPAVLINEIRIDQPGTDNDEYFELVGEPGTSLAGVTYIVIGDGSAAQGSGVIEAIVDLNDFALDANGYFLVAESTFTFPNPPNLVLAGNGLNFENGDNVTHLLVYNFSGANGQDLDLNDDGVLDIQPWQAVIDGVGLITENYPPAAAGQEWVYAGTVGPDGAFVPGHVYRCVPDGSWSIGPFDPVGGLDTPGAANAECGIVVICGNPASGDCFTAQRTPGCNDAGCCEQVCDLLPGCCETAWDADCADLAFSTCLTGGEAPTVLISEIRIDQPSTDNDEYFELVAAPGTSLDGVTYIVIGDGASAAGSGVIEAIVDLTGTVVGASGRFVVAESTFTLGTADLVVGATGLNFENGDNVTHLLVFNFFGSANQDLDLDDDGTLDILPWQSILDSVGIVGPNFPPKAPGQEWAYGPVFVGPEFVGENVFLPAHVYRCEPALAGGAWQIGPFDTAAGVDSPGAANPDCDEEPTPCPADLNDDGVVDGADLGLLLSAWGNPGPSDLNGDSVTDGADLGLLLSAWGACPR